MDDDASPDADNQAGRPTRRRALMLGAVGAASVVSIRPALAQTAGSVLACDIPVPDAGRAGKYISADGNVVPPGTAGAFPPPGRPLKGEEVRRALAGGSNLPGYDYERSRAYLKYVQRLQRGTAGFTCFASVQMLRK
ncbi:hypothetical protein KZ810_10260 [Sphingomonas sp. RHCKR47]|jgi:hypothetical protein|uniref:hypothetical protein n=1 Tax=Sphingomonas citricola TaxID=2862498 RepID=UPI001CA5EDC0|nr:hypothetical protein [Sphingomonas citricola]MBW6523878.1 hypothetical protein [Sphingomonas citricola]